MGKQKSNNEVIVTMYEVAAKHARQLGDEYLEVYKRLQLLGAGDHLERAGHVCISLADSLLVATEEYKDDDVDAH